MGAALDTGYGQRRQNAVLAAPLVLFLLALLGFPAVMSVIYALSTADFETLTSPRFAGLSNFATVLSDPAFWQATWFSTRFAIVTTLAECTLDRKSVV